MVVGGVGVGFGFFWGVCFCCVEGLFLFVGVVIFDEDEGVCIGCDGFDVFVVGFNMVEGVFML